MLDVRRRINEKPNVCEKYLRENHSLFLSFQQDELTRGTFDMRDVNVARKTIYGYSKIVQISLSVRHAGKSWRI